MVLAFAGIFPIRQAAILRNTMSVSTIRVTRKLSWAELTRPAATVALSGTRVLRVNARMSTSAFSEVMPRQVSLALVTKTWRLLVRLPRLIREREDGRPHCRIEMCNVAPIGNHASRTTLANCLHGCAIRHTFDAGQTVQNGVLNAPTDWTVRSVARNAFSSGHTCNPAKRAVPTPASTDIFMHNIHLRRGDRKHANRHRRKGRDASLERVAIRRTTL